MIFKELQTGVVQNHFASPISDAGFCYCPSLLFDVLHAIVPEFFSWKFCEAMRKAVEKMQ